MGGTEGMKTIYIDNVEHDVFSIKNSSPGWAQVNVGRAGVGRPSAGHQLPWGWVNNPDSRCITGGHVYSTREAS